MQWHRIMDRLDAAVARYRRHRGMVLRGGLGVTIFLAGVDKLIEPAAWHAYLAPPLVAIWPTGSFPLTPTFALFGISEILFGVLLLADWHTPTVAAATAVSIGGVVINLAIGIAVGEPYVDVLIRDFGLMALAAGVALEATAPAAGGD